MADKCYEPQNNDGCSFEDTYKEPTIPPLELWVQGMSGNLGDFTYIQHSRCKYCGKTKEVQQPSGIEINGNP